MANSRFENARIRAMVTCLPKKEKCIDDEVALFGGNVKQVERIKKTVGLHKRRVVEDGTTALDLCREAGKRLLAGAGLAPDAIDALIFVTQTPDYLQPCNAAVVHGQLGLATRAAAFDVNLGCSGYVYGLWLANMMVSSGGCERVLLLTGDTLSRLVHPQDRSVAPVFGDGGSASLIERADGGEAHWFSLHTDGAGFDKLMVPAGGMRRPRDATTGEATTDAEGNVRTPEHLFMDGAEIFNFSIGVEPRAVRELLDYAEVEIGSVDHFVFHQANRYILTNIAKRLKIDPAKVPMRTVEHYGNQSSTSIPCAICGELGEALLESKRHRALLSGFGVGLSWASALLELGDLSVCEIMEYGL